MPYCHFFHTPLLSKFVTSTLEVRGSKYGVISVIPVHTYSIVARDPTTGELGVAVQSHSFSVGSVVSWAEAGVGVVATQSFVNLTYGPEGLARMKSGQSAPEALADLVARDPERDLRQVAMVDAAGASAAHTGERCIAAAGHLVGDGYSVQANIMIDSGVWPAMARAYQSASGDLADRLVAALEAAQEAGWRPAGTTVGGAPGGGRRTS